MKPLSPPPPALFFTAILADSPATYTEASRELEQQFGSPALSLSPRPFTHSTYYRPEMGDHLIKGFLAWPPPFEQDELKHSKLLMRRIEWRWATVNAGETRRRINIDPGCVTLSKTILATGKNFAHRIYLGDGIFAEITLIYHPAGWEILPWTFPDYRNRDVQVFLLNCRRLLKDYLDTRRQPSG